MKYKLMTLSALLLLFVSACNSTEQVSEPVEEIVVEEVIEEAVEEATAEEPVEEEVVVEDESMAEVVSEQVEITLIDPLDGVTNSYCLDIAGGNENVDPSNGLQAHTCYSYQGDLGTDQIFDTAGFASGILYMPIYDVCAQVASVAAGAELALATCDGSDLQSFVFGEGGTISPASDTSLCVTASAETRFGRSGDHQISDTALAACSDDQAIYQQWGYRSTLDDPITVISGAHAMDSDDMMAEDSATEEEVVEEAPAEEAAEDVAAVEEPAEEAPMTEVVSEQVEITLIDPLDGVTNSYCLDIAGGNENVDPSNGLQAHTCYSYRGDLGTDQIFDTAGFASGILYMPVYDVCAQVASVAAGAELALATCDGSDLQSFVFGESGTISPASDTSLCVTASSETRFGRSGDHQISDTALAACSDDQAIYQQWGYRTSLEDEITVISGSHAMGGEAMGEGGDAPDLAAAAETLGVSEQELQDALGGPPPDFAAAAETLGISEEEIQAAMGDMGGGGRGEGEAGAEDINQQAETEEVASQPDLSLCDTTNVSEISTDENVEVLRQAIVAFRASLSEELLGEASNCLDSARVYLWHNTPANDGNRDGITYGDLTDEQYALFVEVLQAFLSDDGYQKVYEITQLSEGFVGQQNSDLWNPEFYSIDMFGDPENTGSWGFQLDGHHAAINFFVNGDDVSIVPAFMGGEPVADTFNGEDFDIFAAERDMGLALYAALTADELAAAVTDGIAALQVGPAEMNGLPDPYIGDYDYSVFATGLKYSEMSADTQALVTELMQVYVYNLETPFADVWWTEISANIDETYFVWSGDGDASASEYPIFYYRFYNPAVWIEYNVESNAGPGVDEGNHGHSIIRVPSTYNGGDYSIFASAINTGPRTLLEHYVLVEHHAASDFNFDYTVIGLSDEDDDHDHDNDHGHSHGG